MQKEREKALNKPQVEENQDRLHESNELISNVKARLEAITGEEDEDDFRRLKANVMSGDGPLGALVMKGVVGDNLTKFEREWNSLEQINDPQEFVNSARRIISEIEAAKPEPKVDEDEVGGLRTQKIKGEKKSSKVQFNTILQKGIDGGWIEPDLLRTEPRSVVDLAKWIMVTDDARIWGPDAVYPLFKITHEGIPEIDESTGEQRYQLMQDGTRVPLFKEKPQIEFQSDSFIIWLRNKMIELHNDNSTDAMSPEPKLRSVPFIAPLASCR